MNGKGRALQFRALQFSALGALAILLLAGCGAEDGPSRETATAAASSTTVGAASTGPALTGPIFIDQAAELGIDFRHDPALSGDLLMPEIQGAGAALVDLDADGDLDLLLVQSRPAAEAGAVNGGSRLYRNLLQETGTLAFEDITAASGLHTRCYGSGVVAGDIDNDGAVDLYIFCADSNELWRNDGSGVFEEIGQASNTNDSAWTTNANLFDFDRDGLLDLYIGNYVDYAPATRRQCRTPAGIPDYCGPLTHTPAPDRLLRNLGAGRFEDVTASSGIASIGHAPSLGSVAADFNADGWQDLYVANDAYSNRLWINQQNGHFVDTALPAGAALNAEGQPEGSMGVDAGDYDGDGDDDLFMVHLADEKATLYAAVGNGQFEDRSLMSGVAALTRGHTGFGTAWIDYDNDGWLDLLIVNGRVSMAGESRASADPFPYAQRMLLLRNDGNSRFNDVSLQAGAVFALERVGRGAAFGDLDNDGDMDAVVSNANAAPFVLINQLGQSQNWLGVRLTVHGRDAYGARAGLLLSDGRTLWRRLRVDGSYAAANDPRILFGYPREVQARALTIVWPDGSRTELPTQLPTELPIQLTGQQLHERHYSEIRQEQP
ncbi:MAG: CRTAC1 family protein [Xanthomonadales bacterium]|nr:CRTAC1 family protein [Xanthomonadales bacterium]